MSRVKLHLAYQNSQNEQVYALEPLQSRVPACFQLFMLRGDKLVFSWRAPDDPDNWPEAIGQFGENIKLPEDLEYNLRGNSTNVRSLREKLDSNPGWLLGFRGIVPDEVVSQGRKAILQHIEARRALRRQRLELVRSAASDRMERTNVAVEITRNRIRLKGRILYFSGDRGQSGVLIKLESPKKYAAQKTRVMSYGRAVLGKYFYTRHGQLADWVIKDAEQFFAEAYEQKQHEATLSPHFRFGT